MGRVEESKAQSSSPNKTKQTLGQLSGEQCSIPVIGKVYNLVSTAYHVLEAATAHVLGQRCSSGIERSSESL